MPFLHSKSFETRSAVSIALSQIFTLVPVWQPSQASPHPVEASSGPAPDFSKFSVQELILSGKLLLASSGKEFTKPTGILSSSAEVKKARKEAMGRLGLEFLDNVADEMDLDKELAADMEVDPEMEADDTQSKSEVVPDGILQPGSTSLDTRVKIERSSSSTPAASSPTTTRPEESADMSNLSARERNRLKRKRKLGSSAFVAAPPPQASGAKYSATPGGQSHKCVHCSRYLSLSTNSS
jgi:TATA-binding protein-associated factor